MLVFITACGTENEVQSDDEGEIIVYTSMSLKQAEKYREAFDQEYDDIEVNLVPLSTDDLAQRLFSEKENPVADVVWSLAVPHLLQAEWNDMLLGYRPDDYQRIESQFRDTVSPPFWVGIQGATNVYCVNPEKIKELGTSLPRSWQDLLDPAYKGQIAMANPNKTGTGYATVTGWLLLYGETEGWRYMDQLDENILEYTSSASMPCNMAAEGQIAIGLTYDDYALTKKNEVETSGKSLEVIFPSEALSWQLYGAALLKKEEVKPAAKTFLDWTISDSAVEQYAQDYGAIPARTKQAAREGIPENIQKRFLNMEFPWAAANQSKILTKWRSVVSQPYE